MLKGRKYSVIEKGAWDKETNLSFIATGNSVSKVVEDNTGNCQIPVTSLDSCEECLNASYIKMDIEGAEMKALEGSVKTIVRNKPKLAICIYHSDEDMIRIIPFVHKLVPEYSIYIRHHSTGYMETVAYFIKQSYEDKNS